MLVRFVFECSAHLVTDHDAHTRLDVKGDLDYVKKVWQETISLGWKCGCGQAAMVETRYVLEIGTGVAGEDQWIPVPGKDWDKLVVSSTMEKIEKSEASGG